MKKRLFWPLVLLSGFTTAQIPLDERLLLTCRVWGFVKYYHEKPRNCMLNWDSVLLANLPAVKAAGSQAAFNNALQQFLDAAGEPSPPVTTAPYVPPEYQTNLDFSWFGDSLLSPSIRSQLDTVWSRFRPSTTCNVEQSNLYLHFGDELANVPSAGLPTAEQRLLVAFRYWNYIEYFFISRDLTDVPWPQTLKRIALQLDTAGSELSYQLSILELISAIDDSHAGSAISPLLSSYFGTYMPLISIYPLQGRPVVRKILIGAPSQIKVGDVITHVDGVPVDTLVRARKKYVSASTPGASLRNLYRRNKNIFAGQKDSRVILTLERAATAYTVEMFRTAGFSAYESESAEIVPAYRVVELPDCAVGYVHMGFLKKEQVQTMYDQFRILPSMVIDLRHYPDGTGFGLAGSMILSATHIADLLMPSLEYPGVLFQKYESKLQPSGGFPYTGNVFVLVNEFTQSQGEYTVMMLEAIGPNVQVIGSQTSGADGDVCQVTLPGGIISNFTGFQVRYPDNFNTQRAGVRIDHTVTPTIEGFRDGHDELLNYALTLAGCKEVGLPESEGNTISVFPNPASDEVTIIAPEGLMTICDAMGLVRGTYKIEADRALTISIGHLSSGMYTLRHNDRAGKLLVAR